MRSILNVYFFKQVSCKSDVLKLSSHATRRYEIPEKNPEKDFSSPIFSAILAAKHEAKGIVRYY